MSYLTERERYQIEILLKERYTPKQIAERLHRHKTTIYREIKRGSVSMLDTNLKPYAKYCPDVAQNKYHINKRNKGADLKIGDETGVLFLVVHFWQYPSFQNVFSNTFTFSKFYHKLLFYILCFYWISLVFVTCIYVQLPQFIYFPSSEITKIPRSPLFYSMKFVGFLLFVNGMYTDHCLAHYSYNI